MKKFDWIIVGGGIAGISLSEILTREGYSVALIEKRKKLASATTREFHEWVHTGSLYTLVKDEMMTLKYILGSLDDILEFYSSFPKMNLSPSEKGLKILDEQKGWFSPNYINFKYRLKNRKLILPWMYSIARSISLIEGIKKHDWLRRRAGILESVTSKYYLPILKNLFKILKNPQKFYKVKTTDFTTNSRILLRDMLTTAMKNGLEVFTDNELINIKNDGDQVLAECKRETIKGQKAAICLGGDIEKFSDVKIKKSFAPIAVVKNVTADTNSFVELDYFRKKCINIITKEKSFGLIGGISLSKREEVEEYFNFMINEHKKLNPKIEILDKYVGEKNEISLRKENRNYLFHINSSSKYKNVWSVIPGKFTLAFSMAPEFYRIIYKKNPKKFFKAYSDNGEYSDIIDETVFGKFQQKN
tara:strand:+ start:303 stop:1553 length:1251 start_codon:yes stop_codon:yes gene_type:complete